MFDLEAAIADWQKSLASQEALSAEDVVELETHLRECVSQLTPTGLSDEEAMLIASRRVGSVNDLDREFAKAGSSRVWTSRLKWMCIGQLVLSFAYRVVGMPFETLGLNVGLSFARTWPEDEGIMWGLAWLTASILFGVMIIYLPALAAVRRRSSWFDRLADWPEWSWWTTMSLMVALPPLFFILAFSDHIGEFMRDPRIAISFSKSLLQSLIVPATCGMLAYVLHRQEQRSELA